MSDVVRSTRGLSRRSFLERVAATGVVVGGAGLFAACGGDDDDDAVAAGTITFIKGPNFEDDLKFQQGLGKSFQASHPKVTVKARLYDWANVETQLTTAFASPNPPDVVYMADTLWPRFADANALLDLTEYVNDPAFAEEKARYPEQAWEAVTYEDKIYGVPLIQGVISVLYVNTDLMKKAGVADAVSSYDAMREAARATRKAEALAPYVEAAREGRAMPPFARRALAFGTPEDAAGLVAFLASDAASGITGQAVGVGGDRLSLWTHPTQAVAAYRDGGWGADDIAEAWPTVFAGSEQSVGEDLPEAPEAAR